MCLVWWRFEPLRYFPVNRADGGDGALTILGRQVIDHRSHPSDQSFDQHLLFPGGHAAALRNVYRIISAVPSWEYIVSSLSLRCPEPL
jgi:hypothetical protein